MRRAKPGASPFLGYNSHNDHFETAVNKFLGTAEVKSRLSEIIGRVRHGDERIIVTRRGIHVAALISIEDLERLEALDRQESAVSRETHPIMDAYGGWCDRDDVDELVEEIYRDRELAATRDFDL
jgi:prevent-host-death family protein